MNDAEYHRLGLPIASSLMESTEKRIGRRVNGLENLEKLWPEAGSQSKLQLRADYLSETEPMTAFGLVEQLTFHTRYSSASTASTTTDWADMRIV